MSVDINLLLQECEDIISQISTKLEQISTQEQQHLELRDLLRLKKQFLVNIQELVTKDEEGIRRLLQYFTNSKKKVNLFLEHLNQDLDTFLQALSQLDSNPIQAQIQLLRTEYEIFSRDDVELQELLQLRAGARNSPDEEFQDKENKVYRIMEKIFGGLDDNLKNTILSKQSVYLFTLLYEMSESHETYDHILSFAIANGVLQTKSIQQLPSLDLLQIIQKFINLRKFCQCDETYDHILSFAIANGVLQTKSIQQLSPPQLLVVIQEFINLRNFCQSDLTYEDILISGFVDGIFQLDSIQQLSSPELLHVISQFGQQFITLRNSCQSDVTYWEILRLGFASGVFELHSIQQLSSPELLHVISQFGQQFITLRDSCQSDRTYENILRFGFVDGIFRVKEIQHLSSFELLKVIPQFWQQFITLRSSCQSEETYENILIFGFARGIFELESIQQLSSFELLQTIQEFWQQFIVLEKLTQNSFQTYLKIIIRCHTLQIRYLISIVKKYSSKSLSILQFLSTIEDLDTILNDENKKQELEYFYTHSKILLLSQYHLYLNQTDKQEFLQSQGVKLQTIINGTYEGEITDELASIVNHIFYPSQISYSFDQYKQTLESHQDNQHHIPQSLRDKKVKVALSSTTITKKQNTQLSEELIELDGIYVDITNYIENNNYQLRENILQVISQFTFNNQIQELYQNRDFKLEIKNIIIELVIREHYSKPAGERIFPLQKPLEDEYESYIYYQEFINDTLNDLKTYFTNIELEAFQRSQIVQSQL